MVGKWCGSKGTSGEKHSIWPASYPCACLLSYENRTYLTNSVPTCQIFTKSAKCSFHSSRKSSVITSDVSLDILGFRFFEYWSCWYITAQKTNSPKPSQRSMQHCSFVRCRLQSPCGVPASGQLLPRSHPSTNLYKGMRSCSDPLVTHCWHQLCW